MQLKVHGLDSDTQSAFGVALDRWEREDGVRRLWAGDSSLWTGADEARWLGWLGVLDAWQEGAQSLGGLTDELRNGRLGDEPLRQVVVMGMGGSSLCADVLRQTFGDLPGAPELRVLDSTVPAQILRVRAATDLQHTLFVVPSKSGTTIEPNAFEAYFFAEVSARIGADKAGSRFLAITDPGTELDSRSRREGFAATCYGLPDIGGRFSALSVFGMVPAALMGIDVADFLERARSMATRCGADSLPRDNPGVALGVLLGTLALRGRDKLTLVPSPSLRSLGCWLEQLIAESTGKNGRGIVPIDGETLAPPEIYGDDRCFVSIALEGDPAEARESALRALEAAGHPVVRIELGDLRDLGGEFFRWEIATAAAGAELGVHPFDQPDVDAAKVEARTLMARFESDGRLPVETPEREESGLGFFGIEPGSESAEAALRAHLSTLAAGDYFAVHAYLEMCDAHDAPLQRLRHAVRDARRIATTVGYGPRFLHSSGQLHKGGANRGVFLQLTCDDPCNLDIPGQRYSFGVLKRAQAAGDYRVLVDRGRRTLRVHLGAEPTEALDRLAAMVERAL